MKYLILLFSAQVIIFIASCGDDPSASLSVTFDPGIGSTVVKDAKKSCAVTMNIRETNGVGMRFSKNGYSYSATDGTVFFSEEFDEAGINRRYGTSRFPARGSMGIMVEDTVRLSDPSDFDVREFIEGADDNGHRFNVKFSHQCRE